MVRYCIIVLSDLQGENEMKKFVSLALAFCMGMALLAGCSDSTSTNEDQSSAASTSSQTKDSSDEETVLTEGNVYDASISVFPNVELMVVDFEDGMHNLFVYIQPDEEEVEDALLTYAQAIRNMVLSTACQEAWSEENFNKILFRYNPSANFSQLPEQDLFSLKLEPCGQIYRMVPDSIGESYASYVSMIESYSKLDKTVFLSERKSKAMLDAFATAELTDLYDESFIEENMK